MVGYNCSLTPIMLSFIWFQKLIGPAEQNEFDKKVPSPQFPIKNFSRIMKQIKVSRSKVDSKWAACCRALFSTTTDLCLTGDASNSIYVTRCEGGWQGGWQGCRWMRAFHYINVRMDVFVFAKSELCHLCLNLGVGSSCLFSCRPIESSCWHCVGAWEKN